jgi:hypothetical protein
LATSVIEGVTKVVNDYGKIIVLEDNLITSPYFLQFINYSLELYEDVQNVYSVNGYMFSIDFKSEFDSFLCPLAVSSWEWGRLKNKWNVFQPIVKN